MHTLLERIAVPPAEGLHPAYTAEHLMELIQAHAPTGLALLRKRHGKVLKALSMKVLQNDADAEDLIQDVFVEIWNQTPSLPDADPRSGPPRCRGCESNFLADRFNRHGMAVE